MKNRKGVSLVSKNKCMDVTDFMKKLESVRKHEAIVHVETDFGPIIPVLTLWDESNRDGQGEDPGDIGSVVLVYSVNVTDHRCATTMTPFSVQALLDRLRRVNNPKAVVHTGGAHLTAEPITSIKDDTHDMDAYGCIGSVLLI